MPWAAAAGGPSRRRLTRRFPFFGRSPARNKEKRFLHGATASRAIALLWLASGVGFEKGRQTLIRTETVKTLLKRNFISDIASQWDANSDIIRTLCRSSDI